MNIVNSNYYVATRGVRQGTWVGYTKGGENIVAIRCRFPGTVRPVTRCMGAKVSEDILPSS